MATRASERITDAEIERARERGRAEASAPGAVKFADYDPKWDKVRLRFNSGAIVALPRAEIRELQDATPQQLRSLHAPFSDVLELPELDVHISIPGLLADFIGTAAAAAEMGRKGGSVRSEAKAKAVRENGKKGGRPRKKVLATA